MIYFIFPENLAVLNIFTRNEDLMLFHENIPYIFNHENTYYPTLQKEQKILKPK